MPEIRLAGVVRESIVDGPGIRFVVFAQGCPHGCDGCHNPKSHDPEGGYSIETEKLLEEIEKNPLLSGVTLSGGEPFLQAGALASLAAAIRARGLSVVTYTGYTLEELLEGLNKPGWRDLLLNTDTLVDGRFVLSERDLTLRFRGSKNQRVIDPAASVREGRTVEKAF